MAADIDKCWKRGQEVLSSGLFFMVVGCIFLFIAYRTMGHVDAAFSFVIVVLGSAILLFGTGTQGMGEFTSPEDGLKGVKYRIGIAGGAGILALGVGLGIVEEKDPIRDVFHIERRYLRVQLNHEQDHTATFKDYLASAQMFDGMPIPTLHLSDQIIEVLIPYFDYQLNDPMVFTVAVSRVGSSENNLNLSPNPPPRTFHITVNKDGSLNDTSGSIELPVYVSKNPNDTILQVEYPQVNDPDSNPHEGQTPPNIIPPPALEYH